MTALMQTADDVLRGRVEPRGSQQRLLPLVACVVAFAGLYGASMGLFRGFNAQPAWPLQMVYAAIKTPMLLIVSFVVSLPSCFVVSTLFGLRRDFGQVVRAIVAAQAGLAVTLAALAPLTLLCYASTSSYDQALVFNGVNFAVASLAGQAILRGRLRPLIDRDARHRYLIFAWGVVYVFVAIQLAWVLRPFVGSRGMDVTFFREEAWDNAYVFVARLVWRTIMGE